MHVVIFVVQCLLAVAIGSEVEYSEINAKPRKVNISATELTNNLFTNRTYKIQVLRTAESEKQIELIANLPRLTDVWIVGVGQEVIPQFQNLPNITVISLGRNRFSYVKKEVFSSTPVEWILLENNEIFTIEKGAFGTNLRILSLRCNKIKNVNMKWFKDTSKLVSLDLSGNEITSLQENLFKNFNKLDEIMLGHNQIATIGDGAFSNRNRFIDLQIDHNLVKQLPRTIFMNGNITINHFYINNNQLTFLKQDFMDKLNVTTKARIYGNPWQCACYDLIRVWIPWDDYKNDKDPEGAPRCVSAISFQKDCVPLVDNEIIEHYMENAPPRQTSQMFCSEIVE